ncbi:MAG: glycosyltransferase family 4 protein [Planctomycetota bacterium]
MSRRLCFISRYSLQRTPYGELTLPALAEAGWDLTVYAPHATQGLLRQHRPYQARFIDLDESWPRLKQEKFLLRALWHGRTGGYDVLYLQSQALAARAALALTGAGRKTKVVYHTMDYFDPNDYPKHYRLEKKLCRRSDLYINNEFHRGYLTHVHYGIKGKTITAPPNLPTHLKLPEPSGNTLEKSGLSRGPDDFVLMLHGGYSNMRAGDEMLEALTLLPPRFKAVMTGKIGPGDDLAQRLDKLGLTDRVARIGRLDYLDMLAHTVECDAGLLLYGNTDLGAMFTAPGRMTEYLACGLPVVATNHTGLENLVHRYRLGVTVDSTQPRRIADGVEQLAERVRAGAFPKDDMRRAFRETFAFDHFEPLVLDALTRLADGALEPGRPDFPWLPAEM